MTALRLYIHADNHVLSSVSLIVQVDQTPPVTSVSPTWGTFTGPTRVTLSSEEGAVISYQLDATNENYTGPFVIYRTSSLFPLSMDSRGNREKPRELPYVIDEEAPSIEVLEGQNNSISPYDTLTLTFEVSQAGNYKILLDPTPRTIVEELEPGRFELNDNTFGGTLLAKGYSFAGFPMTHKIPGNMFVSGVNQIVIVHVPAPPPRDMDLESEEVVEPPDTIEAMIIPRLGLAKQEPKKMPKLEKYEQPEKLPEAINIKKENPPPEVPKPKALEYKPAELDKTRPKKQHKRRTLSDIIGAPEDDDPRKRPTRLEKIVGDPGGSVWGSGAEGKEGNIYAGHVMLAIRRNFSVPTYISDQEVKGLKVEILISAITADGRILSYNVERLSSNQGYDAAAIATIKKFMPSQGGAKRLPKPPAKILSYINQNGMRIVMDGKFMGR